jgi:hypothetical protein
MVVREKHLEENHLQRSSTAGQTVGVMEAMGEA